MWVFIRPTSQAFSMMSCGQVPSLSYSQATGRISFSAKSWAISRRFFCSSVSVKSTMVWCSPRTDAGFRLTSQSIVASKGSEGPLSLVPRARTRGIAQNGISAAKTIGVARRPRVSHNQRMEPFTVVVVGAVVLFVLVGVGSFLAGGSLYDKIGEGGLSVGDG